VDGDVFDAVAERYDASRPGYPEGAVDAMLALAGASAGARALEIGAGTGQLSVALADRGLHLTCIEPGDALGAILRRKLPQAEVIGSTFEDWDPGDQRYDLVVSATAFHWLDVGAAIPKIRRALEPDGALALVWNEHVRLGEDDAFARHLQPIYDRLGPGTGPPGPPPLAADLPDRREDLRAHGVGAMERRQFPWTASYSSQEYLDLVATYSGHITLPVAQRHALFAALRDAIDALPGGRFAKGYLTDLYVARADAFG
jgi:SAM-dependent methyltransferase